MRLSSHTQACGFFAAIYNKIGEDGKCYSIICAKEPRVNSHDLYTGGVMYSFQFDLNKNITKLYKYHYLNGVPTGLDCLKKWKDDILTEKECLEYIEMLEKEGAD